MCRIHFANSFFTLVLGEFAPLFYEISYYVLFCICLCPWFRPVFACLTSHDLHMVKRYNNFHVIAKQRCLYPSIISKCSNLVSLTWESCFAFSKQLETKITSELESLKEKIQTMTQVNLIVTCISFVCSFSANKAFVHKSEFVEMVSKRNPITTQQILTCSVCSVL